MDTDGDTTMNDAQKLEAIRKLAKSAKTLMITQDVLDILYASDIFELDIPIGSRVMVYMGMGETEFGVLMEIDNPNGRALVKFDGYIEPTGKRFEPYDLWITNKSVLYDPDPTESARADQENMLDGYRKIEAKYNS